jgi:hypothetical protein
MNLSYIVGYEEMCNIFSQYIVSVLVVLIILSCVRGSVMNNNRF